MYRLTLCVLAASVCMVVILSWRWDERRRAKTNPAPSGNVGAIPHTESGILPTADIRIEPATAYKRVFEDSHDLSFEFRVVNASEEPVRVLSVKADCGCTSTYLDEYVIQPNASARLAVRYDSGGAFGDLPERRIVVLTDRQGQEQLQCKVAGYRQRLFRVSPPTVDFGRVPAGTAASRSVIVETDDAETILQPERTLTNRPWITLQAYQRSGTDDATKRFDATVEISPLAPQGDVHAKLFIPQQRDNGVGAIIHVHARVVGPIELSPPKAFLGILTRDSNASRCVELQPSFTLEEDVAPPALKIVGFGDVPMGLDLEIDPDRRNVIRVTGDGTVIPAGRFEHEILVKCTLGDSVHRVLLPIHGWNASGAPVDRIVP